MESSLPIEIAETIQTAHINRAPSPRHDINPSTAASEKEPVSIQTATRRNDPYSDLDDGDDEEDVPYSIVKPRRRSANLPPMPDLRFEQSYLNSISKADTWGKVAWITVRDQVRFYLD
jgi:pyocin large subunit-like protein